MTGEPAERLGVEVGEGRSVEVLIAWPTGGLALVFHTGTPSGLVPYPPLVDAAAVMAFGASCTPGPAPGLDWLAGMAAENIAEFGAAMSGEAELTAVLTGAAAGVRDVTGADIVEAFGSLVTHLADAPASRR